MKQKFTKESIVMHDGEVLLLATRHAETNGYLYFPDAKEILKVYGGEKHAKQLNKSELPFNEIVYSTKHYNGIPQLDRKEFVKQVDLEALAANHAMQTHGTEYTEPDMQRDVHDTVRDFKAGYNANPNEFTREDMELAFKAGCLTKTEVGWSGFGEFINNLRPLSIPEQVTIENNKVISVVWK